MKSTKHFMGGEGSDFDVFQKEKARVQRPGLLKSWL
jgi:hypothetical protein